MHDIQTMHLWHGCGERMLFRMATTTKSTAFTAAVAEFGEPRGYLAVASIGIPPRRAVDALAVDLQALSEGWRDPQGYDAGIERARASFGTLVHLPVARIAQGSQTSVLASQVAAAVPPGSEVLCIDGDFSSIMFPFLQRPDLNVRTVPLAALADSITDATWLVVFSLVQSATGEVSDGAAIAEAAARHGAYTMCDFTQAAGVLPVDARPYDITVTHTYKWLCSPRGVAFMTLSERFEDLMTPYQAGWYAGADVWRSTYGPAMNLAPDARKFDVSPAWQAWIGAEQSLALFSELDMAEVWAHTASLGDALCEAVGIPAQHRPIVTWPDSSGDDLGKLMSAGIRCSGRAGRLRASFHLWNDLSDVDAVARALR